MWDDFARMYATKNSIPLNNYLISHLMKYDEIFYPMVGVICPQDN